MTPGLTWEAVTAMPPAKDLNPSDGPLAFVGYHIRRFRTRAGLTQQQLADKMHFSDSTLGQVETGDVAPSQEFLFRCAETLATELDDRAVEEFLKELWPLVSGQPFPKAYRPFVEYQRAADHLRSFEPLVIPGLLQTEDYARALLRGRPDDTDEQVEKRVAARMGRQEILDRDDPPVLNVVITEAVLRQPIGTDETMRDQLDHLIEMARRRRVTIQVIPTATGSHVGLQGGFIIATVAGKETVYLGATIGQILDRPDDVKTVLRRFESLVQLALPPQASIELIEKVKKELWT